MVPLSGDTEPRDMSLDDLAAEIAVMVADRRDTFPVYEGMLSCDIGGTFVPTCGTMRDFASSTFQPTAQAAADPIEIDSVLAFRSGDSYDFAAIPASCYYEVYKNHTHIQNIVCQVRASGTFVLTVLARGNTEDKILQSVTLAFDAQGETQTLPPLALASLPQNASLMLRARCLSQEGRIFQFRWLGQLPQHLANTGDRIYLIRAYRGRAHIITTLLSLGDRLASKHPDVARRSLFVVYDASGDESMRGIVQQAGHLRMVELRGANFGGGGNASLLLSLFLRVLRQAKGAVAEGVIIDDDAWLDAETLIRQDAFITARKDNVISTAVIYAAEHPSLIQEYGGYWGKFFSHRTYQPSVPEAPTPNLLQPYLLGAAHDVSRKNGTALLTDSPHVEFATFICISFPAALLKRTGASFPFFLRNDDVEICLRARRHGGLVAVNPNLAVWHSRHHSAISEFYVVLHGLLLNSVYGGIAKLEFFTLFMDRLVRLGAIKNLLMLNAYTHILEVFSQGPAWMQPDRIFQNYQAVQVDMQGVQRTFFSTVPLEVYQHDRDTVQLYTLLEPHPSAPNNKKILFVDTGTRTYSICTANDDVCSAMLQRAVQALHACTEHFDDLVAAWKDCLEHFDHVAFWNAVLPQHPITLVDRQADLPDVIADEDVYITQSVSNLGKPVQGEEGNLPMGFTEEGYFAHNPDVAQSGMDAATHYLRYGRHEGRQF